MDEKEIKRIVIEQIKGYNSAGAFTSRRLIDTPTDAYAVVNRRFVTLSSNLGARPVSSVAVVGQRFFDTSNNIPIWYTTAGWRNAVGSIVALNN